MILLPPDHSTSASCPNRAVVFSVCSMDNRDTYWASQREPLSTEALRFEIKFALGQAPAGVYADIRRSDRTARERGLDSLTEMIMQRFEKMVVIPNTAPYQAHSIRCGWEP